MVSLNYRYFCFTFCCSPFRYQHQKVAKRLLRLNSVTIMWYFAKTSLVQYQTSIKAHFLCASRFCHVLLPVPTLTVNSQRQQVMR